MKLIRNVLWIALLAAGGAESQRPILYPGDVSKEISWKELTWHIEAFTRFAKVEGSRSLGTLAFLLSADYTVRGINHCGTFAKLEIRKHHFIYSNTSSISLKGPDGDPVNVTSVKYNTRTWSKGFRSALAAAPVDEKRGSGCFEDQWKGIKLKGRIALIKGGHCKIADKVALAKERGAGAVILYDQPPRSALSSETAGKMIPVAVVDVKVGQKWSERLGAGEKLKVKLKVEATNEKLEAFNMIVDTAVGSPDDVIMLGARLDSTAGPGINDNASGSSALIEILRRIHVYKGHSRRIRFAFWGGEMGSAQYLAQLNETEAAKIRIYMDINTIGTHNPTWTVFSDDAKDRFASKVLFNYLKDTGGVNVTYSEPKNNSDSAPFRRRGIPCTGITTGADSCQNLACDTLTNINMEAIYLATQAATFGAARLATPGRTKTSLSD
ncbi:peptidase family M28 domain-containing protein [Hirsutella rhossiliensis]|uniref:Peptide hydrolase n=1 Tax=Hirsutella rhossiliensis TaxID=111463 RepID=A0A9P8N5F2_9HYPO|nr:peptidase family m28 domain-containing protein [Hirsutella rhossiliensis]KAH0966089.1 peptidase family m28 domain-containing protein [Hirsutella rhossiliensis]